MEKRLMFILDVLIFLVSSASTLAQIEFSREGSSSPWKGSRRLSSQSQRQIERMKAQEPHRRVESEAGHIGYFDARNEEFDCAGVSTVRRTIRANGLLLPQFSNAPSLVYVIREVSQEQWCQAARNRSSHFSNNQNSHMNKEVSRRMRSKEEEIHTSKFIALEKVM